jgi:cytoskeletal protein RodZ
VDKLSFEHRHRLRSRDLGLQRLTSVTAVLFVTGLVSTGGIAYAASTTQHHKAPPEILAPEGSQGSGDSAERPPAAEQTPAATTGSAPSVVAPPVAAPKRNSVPQPAVAAPKQNSVPQPAVVPAQPAKQHAAVSSGS